MIEEGTYRARALRALLGWSGTGKEQLGIEWMLLDGTDRRITSYHYFSSDKAIEISMDALRAAGFKGNNLEDLSSLTHSEANPTTECELVIEHEEYNGKWSARVRFVNAVGGLAMAKPLDGGQARSFAARMRGAIAAYDQERNSGAAKAAGKPKPAAGPAASAAPSDFVADDSDVPF